MRKNDITKRIIILAFLLLPSALFVCNVHAAGSSTGGSCTGQTTYSFAAEPNKIYKLDRICVARDSHHTLSSSGDGDGPIKVKVANPNNGKDSDGKRGVWYDGDAVCVDPATGKTNVSCPGSGKDGIGGTGHIYTNTTKIDTKAFGGNLKAFCGNDYDLKDVTAFIHAKNRKRYVCVSKQNIDGSYRFKAPTYSKCVEISGNKKVTFENKVKDSKIAPRYVCESKAGEFNNTTALKSKIDGEVSRTFEGSVDPEGHTDPEEFKESAVTASEEDQDGGTDEPSCFDGGGAVGWILCPVVNLVNDMFEGFYDKFLAPAMKIDSTLLSNDDSKGTHEAWGIFRDMANMAFIALFLFVIFSQLTGVGIDNYGIKKTLPKLILTAILINVSYVICQLAADVSNIVGYGAKDLLFSIANQLPQYGKINIADGEMVAINLITFLAGGAGVAAVIANPALIATGVIAIIGAGIALAFLFVLLAARKAAIVLLVAVSPIAMVLYSLPNTKGIFDKWFNFFKTMLMVFPISGLIMGAGQLASRIILTTAKGEETDALIWIIGLIVSGVPIFFIPSLIKQSMSVMGSLGTRLAGMGSALSSGAKSRMTNSRLNQTAQRIGGMRASRLRAGLDKDGKVKTGSLRNRFANSRVGRVTGARASMADARRQYLKGVKEGGSDDLVMSRGAYEASVSGAKTEAARAAYAAELGDLENGEEKQRYLEEAIAEENADKVTAAIDALGEMDEFDRITASLMGGVDEDGIDHGVGVTSEMLNDDAFRIKFGDALIQQKGKAAYLGGYAAAIKNGSRETITQAASSGSIQKYTQKFGDSVVGNMHKTALKGAGLLTNNNASSLFSTTQVAKGINGLDSSSSRQNFIDSGFVNDTNRQEVAAAMTSGAGIVSGEIMKDEHGNTRRDENGRAIKRGDILGLFDTRDLRSNSTLMDEINSSKTQGFDARYVDTMRTNL